MNSAFVGYEELSRSRRVLSTSTSFINYNTLPHSLIAKHFLVILAMLVLKLEKVLSSSFLSIATDDRKQPQCLNIVLNNKIRP